MSSKRTFSIFLAILQSQRFGPRFNKIIMFKSSFLIFTIDDIFDEYPVEIKNEFLKYFNTNILYNNKEEKYNIVKDNLSIIHSIKQDLLSVASDSKVKIWEDSLIEMVNSMSNENSEIFTNLEDYLKLNSLSVGVKMYSLVVAILTKVDLENDLTRINVFLHSISRYVRLVNDLASYQRELGEGKVNNAIIILNKNNSQEKSISYLKNLAYEEINNAKNFIFLKPRSRVYKKSILSSLETIQSIYKIGDFHTLNKKNMHLIKILLKF